MKKRWEKAVSILSSITLLAAAVPAVLLASAEGPVIPDVSSWRYVSIQEYDNQATGKIVWGESNGTKGNVLATVTETGGAHDSKALYMGSNLEGNPTNETQYCQPFFWDTVTTDLNGAEEFWVWLDTTGYAGVRDLQIRPRLMIGEKQVDLKMIGEAVYYLQDEDGWKASKLKASTGESKIPAADLENFKGYIRLPLTSFKGFAEATGDITQAYGGYWIFDFAFKQNDEFEQVENGFYIDNILLAGSNMTNTAAKTVKSLLAPPAAPTTGYSYKFVQNMESLKVGDKHENWGGYCKNVSDMVTAGVGADGTQGLVVSSTAAKDGGAYCQPYYNFGKADDFAGATELWIWLDMTDYGNAGNLKIRPRFMCGDTQIDSKMKSGAVYYLQDGEGWLSSSFVTTEDPATETSIPGADLTGFKGYIRLPLASFNDAPTGSITSVSGAYFIYDFNFQENEEFENVPSSFVIDNLLLAGPSMTNGAAITTLFDGSLEPDPTEPTEAMKEAAAAAKAAIEALPATDALTLEDADDVAAARELYDAVDVLAISLVDNVRKLVEAEEKIQLLKDQAAAEAADKAAAQAVIDQIDALKAPADITSADIADVKAVKTAFDALTATQQALVTNKEKLENAVKQVSLLENRRPEDPDPSWKYLNVVDFENLEENYNFASEEDGNGFKYMFGPQDNKAKYFQSLITNKGYKGSKAFTFQGVAGNLKGQYAQPLLRLDQLVGSQFKDYTGAEEMLVYVDFTNIKLDSVGMQFRFMENDFKEDGTLSGGITQWGLKEGAFVYILDANGNWVKVSNSDSKYETAQNKLPVEVTGRLPIGADPDSELFKDGLDEVKGYKGFVRIPLSQFEVIDNSPNENNKMDLKQVTQLWMVFNYPADQDSAYFVMDEIGFAGHFAVAGQGEESVLNYLSMSSGKTDEPSKPDDEKPSPDTGATANGIGVLFAGSALTICYCVRKKKYAVTK